MMYNDSCSKSKCILIFEDLNKFLFFIFFHECQTQSTESLGWPRRRGRLRGRGWSHLSRRELTEIPNEGCVVSELRLLLGPFPVICTGSLHCRHMVLTFFCKWNLNLFHWQENESISLKTCLDLLVKWGSYGRAMEEISIAIIFTFYSASSPLTQESFLSPWGNYHFRAFNAGFKAITPEICALDKSPTLNSN